MQGYVCNVIIVAEIKNKLVWPELQILLLYFSKISAVLFIFLLDTGRTPQWR